jgi:hypothetical protein
VTKHIGNAKVIERAGDALGEELSDGLSAWKRTIRRPGWERLLRRVKLGESDGCVVWHTECLFRQPRDLEALIELAEHGYQVFSTQVNGTSPTLMTDSSCASRLPPPPGPAMTHRGGSSAGSRPSVPRAAARANRARSGSRRRHDVDPGTW